MASRRLAIARLVNGHLAKVVEIAQVSVHLSNFSGYDREKQFGLN